ncbi:MAG: NUDIX hydrolase [Acidobacteria bacterium]|nr:NUDIX hydrolase [Acidobacteriota bacterium]
MPDAPYEPAVPRDSATVILARDGAGGLEVFMLERHLKSDFAGGAYVFPGGTVDERDCDPELAEVTDGLPPDADALYGAPPERAIGFPVCAIRETFEEAGVLLARADGGRPVRLDGGDGPLRRARRRLHAREIGALDLARTEGIRLAADLLHFYARWITPELAPRRYDARFFVAAIPDGQEPVHDEVETTAGEWLRPAGALQSARAGALTIIFPTRKMLESLAPFGSVAELIAACRGRRPEPVMPRVVLRGGAARILLPGDPVEHEP